MEANETWRSGPTVPSGFSRWQCWALVGALGLVLVACASSSDDDAPSTPVEAVETEAAQPDSPAAAGEPKPLLGSSASRTDEREEGLKGPEFYRGSGVLARDGASGRLDVGVVENGRITLNFANAQIRDVIDVVLGDTLNANYIIDPAVQGQVTVRTSQPLSRADVIPALENILALNGVAMTLVNGTYMVVPQDIAATALSTPVVSPTQRQLARGFGINVIPLNYVSAASMQEILEPFVGPGALRADDARNMLIYSGSGSDARDLMEMVRVFDVDWMRGMSFALFPVEVADVNTMVAELESVFLQEGASPLAGLIRFAPIERLNAVLAISPQSAYLEQVESWIDRLDRGLEGAGRRIFVYYVENGRAADLADILSQVFGGGGEQRRPLPSPLAPGLTPVELATPPAAGPGDGAVEGQQVPPAAPPPTQLGRDRTDVVREGGVGQAVGALIQEGSEIRIIADEASNALLVLATAAEFRMIEATLKKLDVIPLQVLIEATIAEVRLIDALRYGLQWFFESGEFSTAFNVVDTAVADSVVPGFSFLFDSGNQQVLLNALTTITDVEVISSPSLMVLDNQSARLQVGDQVPIATQQSASTNPGDSDDERITSSIQQLDTGVVLEVTPRVNTGGLVVMEIVQEVSTPVTTTTSDLDSPTIQQRRIESTVAIQSGETIALGGLIRDDQEETINGVPLLSDIPILGHLFKTTSESIRRTELLVLITPRVVRNQTDARKVTEELRERLKSIEPLEDRVYKTPKSAS